MISFLVDIIHHIFNFLILIKFEFLNKYIYGFSFIKALELSVFCLGFLFIHLMIKENPYAWLVATYNCSILVFIWAREGVIGQVPLYIFFVGNSLYAFFKWRKKDKDNQPVVKLKWLKWQVHLMHVIGLLVLVTLAVLTIKYLKTHFGMTSNQTVKDMFILIFSIYALILQVKKNIESWMYFTIIDAVVFLTYLDLGLLLLAIVRGYVTVMSGYGFFKWVFKYNKTNKLQRESA